MVDFFYRRVINGVKKWTDVPKLWKEQVKQMLVENGYILNEDGTVTKYEPDTDNIMDSSGENTDIDTNNSINDTDNSLSNNSIF